MQNNYKVLGLTPDAELGVIKAAYRALCKKYHPDRYQGDTAYATEMMQKINSAYGILSKPQKKERYDKEWGHCEDYSTTEQNEQQFNARETINEEWGFAVSYYPILEELKFNLEKLSPQLGYAFQILIIEEKGYRRAVLISDELGNKFLEKYFGRNKAIKKLAMDYIFSGNRKAARELNKAVKVFGYGIDGELIIKKIKKRYPLASQKKYCKDSKRNSNPWTRTYNEEKQKPWTVEFGSSLVATPIIIVIIIVMLSSLS